MENKNLLSVFSNWRWKLKVSSGLRGEFEEWFFFWIFFFFYFLKQKRKGRRDPRKQIISKILVQSWSWYLMGICEAIAHLLNRMCRPWIMLLVTTVGVIVTYAWSHEDWLPIGAKWLTGKIKISLRKVIAQAKRYESEGHASNSSSGIFFMKSSLNCTCKIILLCNKLEMQNYLNWPMSIVFEDNQWCSTFRDNFVERLVTK